MRIGARTGWANRNYGGYKINEGELVIEKYKNVSSSDGGKSDRVQISINRGAENKEGGFLSMSPEIARWLAIAILASVEEIKEEQVRTNFKDGKIVSIENG